MSEQKLQNIADAIDNLDTSTSITTGLDTETFNMLSFYLGELAENTKRIANALERMEEA